MDTNLVAIYKASIFKIKKLKPYGNLKKGLTKRKKGYKIVIQNKRLEEWKPIPLFIYVLTSEGENAWQTLKKK